MKRKSRFREIMLEIICALALTLVCFALGALILHLFGIDGKELLNMDSDLVVLVGVGMFLAIFIVSYFLVQFIKKKKKK